MNDLIILVADGNMKATLEGLLKRQRALRIRNINFKILVHPERDPGVYNNSIEILRGYWDTYEYALILLDKEGSGQEDKTEEKISKEIKDNLIRNGWKTNRIEVIVIVPELDIWMWANSNKISEIIRNRARGISWNSFDEIKSFLEEKGFWIEGNAKPNYPKEALEKILEISKIPRSSDYYKTIAEEVSFKNCQDEGFNKFINIIHKWFSL